ncbi:MAG: hypothetical protein HWE27_04300 [Gammaproteobacteria bacterium]|nr:hypothetical protein [Gammaproteobacteria bacterium]
MEATYLTYSEFWQFISIIVLGLILFFGFIVFIAIKFISKPPEITVASAVEPIKDDVPKAQGEPERASRHFVSQQEFSAYLNAWRKSQQIFNASEMVFKRWLEGRLKFNEAYELVEKRLSELEGFIEESLPLFCEAVRNRVNELVTPSKKLVSLGEAHSAYLASIGTRAQYTDFMQYDSGKEKEKARRLIRQMSAARISLSSAIYQRCSDINNK